MAFIFPEDKADFTAPNGVTYAWDGTKWVTKTFKSDGGDYLPLTGGTLTGRTTINKVREDKNSIAFSIAGRIRNSTGDVVPDILFKSYQRNESDVQPDYLVYYGSGGGANEVLNRTTAQNEFAAKGTFDGSASDLEERIADGEATQATIQTTVNTALGVQADIQAEQIQQNTSIDSLQNQIDDLGITKGALATYQCAAVALPYNPRNGECAFNDATASSAIVVGFGTEDKDGALTKPILNGDIIEIEKDGIVSRYKVLDNASAPSMVACEFVSGDQTFAIGQEYVVYIYPQNESGASKDYVDAQDTLLQDQITDKANKTYVDDQFALKLNKAGDTIDGELQFSGGDDTNNLSIYPNKQNDDSTITALNGSALRFRTVPTSRPNDTGKKTHIAIETNDLGEPITHIYHLADATEPDQPATLAQVENYADNAVDGLATEDYVDNAVAGLATEDYVGNAVDGLATEDYVDEQIAAIPAPTGGGVPVGSIMIWLNSDAPEGWFKLQGGSFDVNANPKLHEYLSKTTAYTPGVLPNWSGRYPGEYGDHIPNPLGSKQNHKTAKPSGGAPKTRSIPDGSVRTFNAAGGTSAYSAGASQISVDNGWDSVTRPPTVVVHYIIKGD